MSNLSRILESVDHELDLEQVVSVDEMNEMYNNVSNVDINLLLNAKTVPISCVKESYYISYDHLKEVQENYLKVTGTGSIVYCLNQICEANDVDPTRIKVGIMDKNSYVNLVEACKNESCSKENCKTEDGKDTKPSKSGKIKQIKDDVKKLKESGFEVFAISL